MWFWMFSFNFLHKHGSIILMDILANECWSTQLVLDTWFELTFCSHVLLGWISWFLLLSCACYSYRKKDEMYWISPSWSIKCVKFVKAHWSCHWSVPTEAGCQVFWTLNQICILANTKDCITIHSICQQLKIIKWICAILKLGEFGFSP